jgi:hypothetical protein
MFLSWLDLLLGFVVWWVGLHFFAHAHQRRSQRLRRGERDRIAVIIMWLSAVLVTTGLLLVLASLTLHWLIH